MRSVRAVFMRGGTSKALIFHAADLPAERGDWDAIFLAAMGSPDPYGRQLDGMGGGLSSLSKVCVVGSPSREDADVDFTFAQIAVDRAEVDYAGTCGNMTAAIGPFAVDEGLVAAPAGSQTVVRVHNTNTGKIVVAHFPVERGRSAVDGSFALDGVPGTAAPIRLDFMDPAGAMTGTLLPTGNVCDELVVPGAGTLRVTMVDATNPCAFVAAADVGLSGAEAPARIEGDRGLMGRLEALRVAAALRMRLVPDAAAAARSLSLPKVVLLAGPAEGVDIVTRTISVGQAHRAIPLTAALCLGVACRVPGSVAHALARRVEAGRALRVGHPSGAILVDAAVETGASGVRVPYATVFRTARRLFAGDVFYRTANPGRQRER